MFFLLSNGKYEHIDRDASSEKVLKKLRKYEDKLEALLIESDTALRSDCYIVVLKDHIKKDFEPFKITYTLAFTAANDTPFESLIKRTLEIDTLNDFYNSFAFFPVITYHHFMRLIRISANRQIYNICIFCIFAFDYCTVFFC